MIDSLDVIIKISIASLAGTGLDKFLKKIGKPKYTKISNAITIILIAYYGISFIVKVLINTMEVLLKW